MLKLQNLKKNAVFGLLSLLFLLPLSSLQAQKEKDPVLLNIAGEETRLSEFLRIFNKNNIHNEPATRQALEEYLELYINFRLKVTEAVELQMDTVEAFTAELKGYRDQLAEPYLTDKKVDDQLVEEAWDRMQEDIRASHILVKLAPDARDKDTLNAYQKIVSLRERILKGEDFGDVAAEASDDQSARDREANRMHPFLKGNRGDLGYFTVFDMVYPFETAAYKTKVGEISMPVRTDYGYHIIKVTARQPAMGRARVAHVFVRFPEIAGEAEMQAAEIKIRQAWDSIQAGHSFESVAEQFSEDKGTAKKGGLLSWFGPNRMVPSFIEAVNSLKEIGDISEPVMTDYGWHIIKLAEKQPIGSFQEEEANIRKRIGRDSRSNLSRESFVTGVKKQYGFSENLKALEDFYSVVNDSIFTRSWKPENARHLNKPLFNLGDKTLSQSDFTAFLDENQRNRTVMPVPEFIRQEYTQFVTEQCIAYKDAKLEKEYPEFRALMQEYHDGILLFELTEKRVWNRASQDTAGLESFFNEKRKDYMWGERLHYKLFRSADHKALEKARKMALKAFKKGQPLEDIPGKINKGEAGLLSMETMKYEKGHPNLPATLGWERGITEILTDGDTHLFYAVHGKVQPEPKALQECRGLVTADYQTYLEKEWLKELRKRYPVQVFPEVLDQVK